MRGSHKVEDNVTQGQLNSQLLLLHGVMKDSNDRNHKDTVKILDQITNIAKESRDTRIEILTMTRENAVEIDNQSARITDLSKALNGVVKEIAPIKVQLTKNTVYWSIAGVVLTALLATVIKLVFSMSH